MKKQLTLTDQDSDPGPKQRKGLDGFKLFYEELPLEMPTARPVRSTRLQRKSRARA